MASFGNFYVSCLEQQAKLIQEQIAAARALVEQQSAQAPAPTPALPPMEQKVAQAPVLTAKALKREKKKRKLASIDPNAPKRPKSAYQIFFMDALAPYRTAHPEKTQREVMVSVLYPPMRCRANLTVCISCCDICVL